MGRRAAALRDGAAGFADWVERTVLVRHAGEVPDPLLRLRLVALIWTLLASELASITGAVIALVEERAVPGCLAVATAAACCLPMIRMRRRRDLASADVGIAITLACAAALLLDLAGGAAGAGALVFLPCASWLAALLAGRRQAFVLVALLSALLLGVRAAAADVPTATLAAPSVLFAIVVPALIGLRLVRARALLAVDQRRQRADQWRADAMWQRDSERFEDFATLADGWYFETDDHHRLRFVAPKLIERIAEDRGPIAAATLVDLIRHYAPGASGIYDLARAMHDELTLCGQSLMWFSSRGESIALRVHAWPAFSPDGQFRGYRGKLREVRFPALQVARALRVRVSHQVVPEGRARPLDAPLGIMRPVRERDTERSV
jgi:hypothetical protein